MQRAAFYYFLNYVTHPTVNDVSNTMSLFNAASTLAP